jgi:hypothetical protein
MTKVLPRLRGVLVTALVWAIVFTIAGALFALVMFAWRSATGAPVERSATTIVASLLRLYTPMGALAGALFALLLALLARRRTLAQLRMPLVAFLGFISGTIWPLVAALSLVGRASVGAVAFAVVLCGTFGAIAAALMLTLARRGSPTGDELAG